MPARHSSIRVCGLQELCRYCRTVAADAVAVCAQQLLQSSPHAIAHQVDVFLRGNNPRPVVGSQPLGRSSKPCRINGERRFMSKKTATVAHELDDQNLRQIRRPQAQERSHGARRLRVDDDVLS